MIDAGRQPAQRAAAVRNHRHGPNHQPLKRRDMMATKKSSTLKTKTTRRAAKPAKAKRTRRPDSVILDLAERHAELLAEKWPDRESAADRRSNVLDRLLYAIVNRPAETLAGLRAKTRILAEEQIISIHDRIPSITQAYRQSHRMFEDRLAFSIWADVERLAKGEAS